MTPILFQCVIPGRPGILKNSKKVCRNPKSGAVFLKASDRYAIWEKMAYMHILKSSKQTQFDFPVNLACQFYFVNHQYEPDTSNAIQGIEDLLQKAKVILDDKLIYSLDGTRKIFGARVDRIEVTLTRHEIGESELVARDQ